MCCMHAHKHIYAHIYMCACMCMYRHMCVARVITCVINTSVTLHIFLIKIIICVGFRSRTISYFINGHLSHIANTYWRFIYCNTLQICQMFHSSINKQSESRMISHGPWCSKFKFAEGNHNIR